MRDDIAILIPNPEKRAHDGNRTLIQECVPQKAYLCAALHPHCLKSAHAAIKLHAHATRARGDCVVSIELHCNGSRLAYLPIRNDSSTSECARNKVRMLLQCGIRESIDFIRTAVAAERDHRCALGFESDCGMLLAEVHTRDKDHEWQMMDAFIGYLDRHLGSQIESISVYYR